MVKLVNVNISEDAWKRVNGHKQPGETFSESLDRIIDEWLACKGEKLVEAQKV